MKSIILALIFLLLITFIPQWCNAAEGDTFTFAPALEGQFIYDASEGSIVPALGLQLIKGYDGVLEGRALVTGDPKSLSELDKIGVGIGVNLPKLVEKTGQIEWAAKVINPSVGVAVLYDLNNTDNQQFGWGVYVVLLKVEL